MTKSKGTRAIQASGYKSGLGRERTSSAPVSAPYAEATLFFIRPLTPLTKSLHEYRLILVFYGPTKAATVTNARLLARSYECVNELVGIGDIPLLAKEGWTRHQENVAKHPLLERTGWSH